jgi:hypothetical protein
MNLMNNVWFRHPFVIAQECRDAARLQKLRQKRERTSLVGQEKNPPLRLKFLRMTGLLIPALCLDTFILRCSLCHRNPLSREGSLMPMKKCILTL